MFNPLLPDLKEIKDQDIENKIAELSKKYSIAARSGNGSLCQQISITLEQYKDEMRRRLLEKSTKITVNNQDQDLDNLININ
jgi:hypothetical protein